MIKNMKIGRRNIKFYMRSISLLLCVGSFGFILIQKLLPGLIWYFLSLSFQVKTCDHVSTRIVSAGRQAVDRFYNLAPIPRHK